MPSHRRLVAALALALSALVARAGSVSALSADDPFLTAGDQWALTGAPASIHAPDAWCVSTGSGVLVGDVDTGASFGHEDLAGKLVAGAAFLGGTARSQSEPSGTGQAAVTDGEGHGTMTTGIMVAATGNGRGVAAVAPDARALVVKALDDSGGGTDSDVAYGIMYAADHGATVINVSIGPEIAMKQGVATQANSLIPGAVDYAYKLGANVALAAGNGGALVSSYPTLDSEAMIVGATRPDGSIPSYSNNGVGLNIYAPGGDGGDIHHLVVAPTRGGTGTYAIGAGTSFAAPQVAGTLALLRAMGMTASQAQARIIATAANRNGVPQLDAAAAVGAASGCSGPVAAASAPPPPVQAAPAPRPRASAQPSTAPTTSGTGHPATATPAPTGPAAAVPSPAAAGVTPTPGATPAPGLVVDPVPTTSSTAGPGAVTALPAVAQTSTPLRVLAGAGALALAAGAVAAVPALRARRLRLPRRPH